MKKPDEQWFSDMNLWEVNSDEWQIRKLKGRNQFLLLFCSKLGEALDERDRCYFFKLHCLDFSCLQISAFPVGLSFYL